MDVGREEVGRVPDGGPIDLRLDKMFNRLAGTGATGRRMLAEAEDHLRSAAEDARSLGVSPEEAERLAVRNFGVPEGVAGPLSRAAIVGATAIGWLVVGYGAATLLAVTVVSSVYRLGGERLGVFSSCSTAMPPGRDWFICTDGPYPIWQWESNTALLTIGIGLVLLTAIWVAWRRVRWVAQPPTKTGAQVVAWAGAGVALLVAAVQLVTASWEEATRTLAYALAFAIGALVLRRRTRSTSAAIR